MHGRIIAAIVTIGVLVAMPVSSFGQAPPPPPASPTLWSFLGVPQACYKINAQVFNRHGKHPGLEKKPPLKGIADPANLKSDVPAIKAAAEIKAAEDLKPQKIKAIKYLATIGCGCYDKDEKITKALLAAMEDCTEEVRLEAIYAIMDAASSGYCDNCNQRNCCNEKITAQLYKIAYELDDLGCPIEPSERVRQAAIEALQICCPNRYPVEAPLPLEGTRPTPAEGTPPASVSPPVPTPPANENRAARVDPNHFLRDASLPRPTPHTNINTNPKTNPVVPSSPPSSRRTARLQSAGQTVQSELPVNQPTNLVGSLSLFDARRNVGHVHFPQSSFQAAVGSRLQVFVPSQSGPQLVGELEVIESFPGSANVHAIQGVDLIRIGRQAQVVATIR